MSVYTNNVRELLFVLEHNDDLRHQFIDVLGGPVQRPKLTYEEFLAWADEDTLAEWVDGDVIMASPASFEHQQIVRLLVSTMGAFVEAHQLGIVLSAPFQMKVQDRGREPDVLFLRNEHRDRLKPTYLDGPADFVVEVVSPESVSRDRGDKFIEYEAAGVEEYWLIDPRRKSAEFYRLREQGRYQTALSGETGEYHSVVVPGFWVRIEWFWHPPTVLDVLRELGLLDNP
jgi:Uma2 family endonuclease